MDPNCRKHLRLGLIVIMSANLLTSCHQINGTEAGQCLTPPAKIRVFQAGHDAGELLPEACVFTNPNNTEIRVYAWVWTESLSFSNRNATFAVDENIRAEANGTLIGRFHQGTSGLVLDGDSKTEWALLKMIMTGDGTTLAIGTGEKTRTTNYPVLVDWLTRSGSELAAAFLLCIVCSFLIGIRSLKRFVPNIRRFWPSP